MYSDSDDSQISQPHLIQMFENKTEINFKELENNNKTSILDSEKIFNSQTMSINQKNVLGQNSNNIKDEQKSTDAESDFSLSSSSREYDQDNYDEEKEENEENNEFENLSNQFLEKILQKDKHEIYTNKTYQNRSIQTSPSFLSKFYQNTSELKLNQLTNITNNQNFDTLDSPLNSPQIVSFYSKHLKKWYQEPKFHYFEGEDEQNLIEEDGCFQKKQIGIFNFVFDEELFYKIKKLFPTVSTNKIRMFMIKYHNQEHDVIAATINSLSTVKGKTRSKKKNTLDKVLANYLKLNSNSVLAKSYELEQRNEHINDENNQAKVEIKLKYLKLLYPDVDELQLFYMLHNFDFKSNIVAKKLEELGYKRINFEDKSIESTFESYHEEKIMPELNLTFDQQEERCNYLKNIYIKIDEQLIKLALKCSKFNLEIARMLLDEIDLDYFKNIKKHSFDDHLLDPSMFIYRCDRGTQTLSLSYFEFGGYHKTMIENKNSKKYDFKSTWTGDLDLNQKVEVRLAIGANPLNHKGSQNIKINEKIKTKGADANNCLGPNSQHFKGHQSCNVKGANELNILKINNKFKSKGSNPNLIRGSIKQSKHTKDLLDDKYFLGIHDETLKNCFHTK